MKKQNKDSFNHTDNNIEFVPEIVIDNFEVEDDNAEPLKTRTKSLTKLLRDRKIWFV